MQNVDNITKFHSAVRWAKSPEEIKKVVTDSGATMAEACSTKDPKNGNLAIHIAAQNGHTDLVKFLLSEKADPNVQNGKGQTPLHMTVEYDFYFLSKVLLDAGADPKKKNGDDHEALFGIDGGKKDKEAWDNPVTILKACQDDKAEIEFALSNLEKCAETDAGKAMVDKGDLVGAGMTKKRTCPNNWDHKRFMACAGKY